MIKYSKIQRIIAFACGVVGAAGTVAIGVMGFAYQMPILLVLSYPFSFWASGIVTLSIVADPKEVS